MSALVEPILGQSTADLFNQVNENWINTVREEVSDEGFNDEGMATTILTPNDESVFQRIKNRLSGQAVGVASMTAVLIGALTLAKTYVTGEEQQEETYFAQSDKSNKTTKVPKHRPNFQKASKMISEGQAPTLQYKTIGIGNRYRKMLPIAGKWF